MPGLLRTHRRLAQWLDEQGHRAYGTRIKPFWLKEGTYAYSTYDPALEDRTVWVGYTSGFTLLANFVAALSVDIIDAFLVGVFGIVIDFFLNEENWVFGTSDDDLGDKLKALTRYQNVAHGFSGIFNVFGGYLAYQALFNKTRGNWLPAIGAVGSMAGNIWAQVTEDSRSPKNHFAHYGGYVYGFIFAFFLSFVKTSTGGVAILRERSGFISVFVVSVLVWLFMNTPKYPLTFQEQLDEIDDSDL
jgi:hypothetical protein